MRSQPTILPSTKHLRPRLSWVKLSENSHQDLHKSNFSENQRLLNNTLPALIYFSNLRFPMPLKSFLPFNLAFTANPGITNPSWVSFRKNTCKGKESLQMFIKYPLKYRFHNHPKLSHRSQPTTRIFRPPRVLSGPQLSIPIAIDYPFSLASVFRKIWDIPKIPTMIVPAILVRMLSNKSQPAIVLFQCVMAVLGIPRNPLRIPSQIAIHSFFLAKFFRKT